MQSTPQRGITAQVSVTDQNGSHRTRFRSPEFIRAERRDTTAGIATTVKKEHGTESSLRRHPGEIARTDCDVAAGTDQPPVRLAGFDRGGRQQPVQARDGGNLRLPGQNVPQENSVRLPVGIGDAVGQNDQLVVAVSGVAGRRE